MSPASPDAAAVICGAARCAPHNFVFLEGVRTCLQAARTPQDGLRAMGRIYAGWALSQTFYRRELWRGLGFKDLEDFLVRSWEASFLRRDMRDLLAQLWTWQSGDISANSLAIFCDGPRLLLFFRFRRICHPACFGY